jgi:RNA polymerase sigma-70 factor (ECF subfamily)
VSGPLFEQIFQEHFSFVWRCLRGLGVSDGDLDDVTQEVFVIVHRRLADLEPELGVRPWLYGILRLVAQNHWRSLRRSATRRQSFETQPRLPAASPLESLQAREAAQLVSAALGRLEPTRREVFILVELEELSVPEVARALGIPINTAYSRLRLARADFKAIVLERGAQ